MILRKNMVLIVGGSVAGVMLLVTLFMLFRFQRRYEGVNSDLRASQQRLDALYARDPFPSEENVLLVQTNLGVLQTYFDGFYGELKTGQIEPVKMEPAEFPLLLGKTMERLRAKAGEVGVALPARFAFGFEHYAVGALPNAGDVPRLVIQVKTVEELCKILFSSKISEMVSINRQVFEAGVVPAGGDEWGEGRRSSRRRGAGQQQSPGADGPGESQEYVDASGLFSREHYVVTFKGKDAAVVEVLNRFARSKMFVVTSRMDMVNEVPIPKVQAALTPAVVAKPGPGGAVAAPVAGPKADAPTHEDRIVAGRESVKATLELDVYRFIAGEMKEAQP